MGYYFPVTGAGHFFMWAHEDAAVAVRSYCHACRTFLKAWERMLQELSHGRREWGKPPLRVVFCSGFWQAGRQKKERPKGASIPDKWNPGKGGTGTGIL